MTTRVYLAGAIELVEPDYASRWRRDAEDFTKYFGDQLQFVNPMSYEPPEGPYYDEQIVNTDKALLASSQVVLLDGRQPGWGSGIEVGFAHSLNIPVVVWGIARDRASIWLRHHATSFHPSLGEAIEQIYALSGSL